MPPSAISLMPLAPPVAVPVRLLLPLVRAPLLLTPGIPGPGTRSGSRRRIRRFCWSCRGGSRGLSTCIGRGFLPLAGPRRAAVLVAALLLGFMALRGGNGGVRVALQVVLGPQLRLTKTCLPSWEIMSLAMSSIFLAVWSLPAPKSRTNLQ